MINQPTVLLEDLIADDMADRGWNPDDPVHIVAYWLTILPQDEE